MREQRCRGSPTRSRGEGTHGVGRGTRPTLRPHPNPTQPQRGCGRPFSRTPLCPKLTFTPRRRARRGCIALHHGIPNGPYSYRAVTYPVVPINPSTDPFPSCAATWVPLVAVFSHRSPPRPPAPRRLSDKSNPQTRVCRVQGNPYLHDARRLRRFPSAFSAPLRETTP